MTESSERKVTGLAPRGSGTPDLSRLRARNRQVDSQSAPTPPATTEPTSAEAAPAATGPQDDSGSASVSFYMHRSVRARAKAAFRATSHLEQDDSWSAFIERAIVAEVNRRERLHNDGRPYEGDDRRLSPGRSV